MNTPATLALAALLTHTRLEEAAGLSPVDLQVAVEKVVDAFEAQRHALMVSAAVFDAIGGEIKAPLAYKAVTEALAL